MKLVIECCNQIEELSILNAVYLIWVPGHSGIFGNEWADELARKGAESEFVGLADLFGSNKTEDPVLGFTGTRQNLAEHGNMPSNEDVLRTSLRGSLEKPFTLFEAKLQHPCQSTDRTL